MRGIGGTWLITGLDGGFCLFFVVVVVVVVVFFFFFFFFFFLNFFFLFAKLKFWVKFLLN